MIALLGPRRALDLARGLALATTAAAALAPAPLRGLAPLPAAVWAALAPFRTGERYGLLVVDGALLAGALLALACMRP